MKVETSNSKAIKTIGFKDGSKVEFDLDTIAWEGTQQPIPEEELKAYWKFGFQMLVLDALRSGKEVKFLAVKKNYNLVEIKMIHEGEFEFSVADKHFYSYKVSDLMDFLNQIWDDCNIYKLNGEVEILK